MTAALCGIAASYAQTGNELTAKAQQYANTVFQDCPQYATPEYIPDYTEILGRIEVITLSEYNSGDYTLLSAVSLKNKCNTTLSYDNQTNFDPQNFNPFKYFLDYYPKNNDKAYRVDNTQYIILVHVAP